MRVVDESGLEVEAGQHGELVARGVNIMRGYWNNAQETSRVFQDGMFRTGDIGYRDGDGYFYILDRLKDMIVTGCGNVSGSIRNGPWADPSRNCDTKGEAMTILQATGTKASSAAIRSGRLFLLELSGDRIHSMNPDGTDRKTIVTNCHLPDGIAVD